MIVKMVTTACGPGVLMDTGKVYEVPKEFGKELVEKGYAVEHKPKAQMGRKKKEVQEEEVLPMFETADESAEEVELRGEEDGG